MMWLCILLMPTWSCTSCRIMIPVLSTTANRHFALCSYILYKYTFGPLIMANCETFLSKHSAQAAMLWYQTKPALPHKLRSSRQQLPWLKAWIGLSVQTWRSSTGPQAAIIRLAAADNCHQTKQDREILPLSAQLFSFSHPLLLMPLLPLLQQTDYMCSAELHFDTVSLGYDSLVTQNVFL